MQSIIILPCRNKLMAKGMHALTAIANFPSTSAAVNSLESGTYITKATLSSAPTPLNSEATALTDPFVSNF